MKIDLFQPIQSLRKLIRASHESYNHAIIPSLIRTHCWPYGPCFSIFFRPFLSVYLSHSISVCFFYFSFLLLRNVFFSINHNGIRKTTKCRMLPISNSITTKINININIFIQVEKPINIFFRTIYILPTIYFFRTYHSASVTRLRDPRENIRSTFFLAFYLSIEKVGEGRSEDGKLKIEESH